MSPGGRESTRQGEVVGHHRGPDGGAKVVELAGLGHHVQDQAALAGGQVELVPVRDVAAALDEDVGVGLEPIFDTAI